MLGDIYPCLCLWTDAGQQGPVVRIAHSGTLLSSPRSAWVSLININHINRLNITHLIMMRKINFYRRLHASRNCILHNVFMSFLSHCCDSMCCTVFINKSSAMKLVTDHFECCVNS